MDCEKSDGKFWDPFHLIRTTGIPENLTDVYEAWGQTYDQDTSCIQYIGPYIAARTLSEIYPSGRETVEVLDVGAGTGQVGVQMQKLGFRVIDGLDPSPSMLDQAKSSEAYRNLYCQYFTSEPAPGLKRDSYDAIISSGSLIPGHLPVDCFLEAVRLVRSGGIICMVTRTTGEGNFTSPGYQDNVVSVTKQLQEAGKLTALRWENIHYEHETNGLILAYRVT